MDEKELWQRFCQGGRVEDYLEYRNCVNMQNKTETDKNAEDNCTGPGDTRTEYR